MQASVTCDDKKIFQKLQLLGKDSRVAAMRAGNRVVKGAITDAKKIIPRKYNVKPKAIAKHAKIKKMTVAVLNGAVIFTHDHGMPLIMFGPRPKTPSVGPGSRRLKSGKYRAPLRGGMSVEVIKGERKKIKSAFVVRTESGHIGVMMKSDRVKSGGTGKDKRRQHYIIEQRYAPSIAQMIENVKALAEIEEGMHRRFSIEFPEQINHLLDKRGIKWAA